MSRKYTFWCYQWFDTEVNDWDMRFYSKKKEAFDAQKEAHKYFGGHACFVDINPTEMSVLQTKQNLLDFLNNVIVR